jgi:hypothetical protein
MIAGILGGIAAAPWARAALLNGAIALTIFLFLLSIRRSGELTGRLVERLETTEKANEIRGCWRRRLVVLAIATSWLTGCATAGFEAGGLAACSPVVEYSREFQARAAEELALLPDGSAIVEMTADYALLREQLLICLRQYYDKNQQNST